MHVCGSATATAWILIPPSLRLPYHVVSHVGAASTGFEHAAWQHGAAQPSLTELLLEQWVKDHVVHAHLVIGQTTVKGWHAVFAIRYLVLYGVCREHAILTQHGLL